MTRSRMSATVAMMLALGATAAWMPAAAERCVRRHQKKREFTRPSTPHRGDIQAALADAQRTHKRVILDFGGDWCPDCQVLNIYFHQEPNAELLARYFVRRQRQRRPGGCEQGHRGAIRCTAHRSSRVGGLGQRWQDTFTRRTRNSLTCVTSIRRPSRHSSTSGNHSNDYKNACRQNETFVAEKSRLRGTVESGYRVSSEQSCRTPPLVIPFARPADTIPTSGVDVAHQIISSTNGVSVPASTSSHAIR